MSIICAPHCESTSLLRVPTRRWPRLLAGSVLPVAPVDNSVLGIDAEAREVEGAVEVCRALIAPADFVEADRVFRIRERGQEAQRRKRTMKMMRMSARATPITEAGEPLK